VPINTDHQLFQKHPLCICGPVGFGGEAKGLVTTEGCRSHARETYGIEIHPVVNADDVAALVATFRERMQEVAADADGR
jgi:hypothetical protein